MGGGGGAEQRNDDNPASGRSLRGCTWGGVRMGVHGEPSTWVHTRRSLRGSAWVCAGRSPRGSTVQGIRICNFGAESKRQYSIKTMSAGREERDFKAETCASKSKER